jgi:predicted small metal-binding protein
MRAMECPDDGHHMEADNDEELFKMARRHTNEAHPEAQLTDEQVRAIVAESAYDKRDILAGIDIPPRAAAFMGGGGMPPSSTRPGPRQKRQDSVQANEEQEGKKGLVGKIKDKPGGQLEKGGDYRAQDV